MEEKVGNELEVLFLGLVLLMRNIIRYKVGTSQEEVG